MGTTRSRTQRNTLNTRGNTTRSTHRIGFNVSSKHHIKMGGENTLKKSTKRQKTPLSNGTPSRELNGRGQIRTTGPVTDPQGSAPNIFSNQHLGGSAINDWQQWGEWSLIGINLMSLGGMLVMHIIRQTVQSFVNLVFISLITIPNIIYFIWVVKKRW